MSADLVAGDRSRTRQAVALLPDEPAGTIATCTAGIVKFWATLAWPRPEDMPPGPMLLEPLALARCSVAETEDPEAATRGLTGEIMAFSPSELGSALEAALRSVTAVATLTEAILEVGAVRDVSPRVAPARALEALARDLWDAGFPVRFGRSWTPSSGADVGVGVGGDGGALKEFLRAHPSWSVA
jgi:hypothetical protein